MSRVHTFLLEARARIERYRLMVWLLHGVAAGGLVAGALGLITRRWPLERQSLLLVAPLGIAIAVTCLGWARGRPSMAEVARLADRRLGAAERLSTAWELAGTGGMLVSLQQSDAASWVETARSHDVVPRRPPRRAVAAAVLAVGLALGVAALPNASLARVREERAAERARDQLADQIARTAEEVEAGAAPGEDEGRRQALVRALRLTAAEVRRAGSDEQSVAALNRGLRSLQDLGARSTDGRLDAAAAAGAVLAASAAGTGAGAALAALGDRSGDELAQLAAGLPDLGAEERQSVAQELEEAAALAELAQAERLRRAADALRAGRTGPAQAALAEAVDARRQQHADGAASALRGLAGAVQNMAPSEQAALASALEDASRAATGDPGLSSALARAGEALRAGDTSSTAKALRDAAGAAKNLPAESALDGAAAKASSKLDKAKKEVLEKKEAALEKRCTLTITVGENPAPAGEVCRNPSADTTKRWRPGGSATDGGAGNQDGQGQGSGSKGEESGGSSSGQASGSEAGTGGAAGAGGSSSGGSSGGSGSGQGAGSSGQGVGNPGGGIGGSTSGGASGVLGDSPGAPNEQVYVPGLRGTGRTPTDGGTGPGNGTVLVPYEQVYAEYQAQALSQADRQLLPERLKALVRQYFQEPPR